MAEFALVMPVLFSLLLGIVTAGLTYDRKLSLTHAARESARFGATIPPTQTFTGTYGPKWVDNVLAMARTRAAGELNGVDATWCISLVEGSGSSGTNPIHTYSDTANGLPRANFTTKSDLSVCDPHDAYPLTTYDNGRRVQVRLSRPSRIEMAMLSWEVTLQSNMSVKSESSS